MARLSEENTLYNIHNGSDELKSLYERDEERFRKSYLSDIQNTNQNQMAARLNISAHSLEKGLSNDEYEMGHGFSVIQRIVGFLEIYDEEGYDKDHLSYINVLSVLKEFYDRHKGTEYEEKIKSILGDWLVVVKASSSTIGGSATISIKDKASNYKKNFKELAEGRFAVRTYSDKPVDKSDIKEAVQIALKSPTVCNRHSVHVRVMYDKAIIAKILDIQGGITHYKTPPVLILVTANDNSYVGANERNQGYIDGGLFAMSLLYALEYKKIAACPLHAMFEAERDFAIRGLLGIPDNEKLITFISAGHFKENNNVCKSYRYPIDNIISEVKELYDYRVVNVYPTQETDANMSQPSLLSRIRIKLRLRTRIKNILSGVKQKTRIRTRMRGLAERWQYSKLDGAILTLTGYFNYGNILQRYALQRYLKINGYSFTSYAREELKTEDPRLKHTASFVDRYIARKPFNKGDRFSSYIVGSDQVWRNWGLKKEQGDIFYYFYDFLDGVKANRIAYAASFGFDNLQSAQIDKNLTEALRPLVQEFDAISVREQGGADIVKETWGKKADVVVDPTMLLTKAQYSQIIDNSDVVLESASNVFSYVLAMSERKKRFIYKISEKYNNQVKILHPKELDVLPPVEYWLKCFRDSEFIVTDSFHGTVFAIINNTPFVVIENEYGGVARITTLLESFGLADRVVAENDLEDFNPASLGSIDWSDVNMRLDTARTSSGQWLLDAIGK